ncbi:MAG: hypothetical protein R2736_04010 [Solirubrobacterales bacterium]
MSTAAPTRVAIVDVGTNSTRLLIADVAPDGTIAEVDRRSTVTRLGEGRCDGALGRRRNGARLRGAGRVPGRDRRRRIAAARAVMTSAVRDAANGAAFAAEVAARYRLDASELSGDEEARLTFLGATSARSVSGPRSSSTSAAARPSS